MIRYAGYSVADYGAMVDCEPRMGCYAEALRRAVTPGCTVIDIGAGFGVFSLLACQYGAAKVIAIEPDPSIELLMPLAQANGFADRIEVVRDISTRYTPAAKADVIVSDCRGNLPLYEYHIATIRDARERLLAPGGTLMPMRDTIRIALASSATSHRQVGYPWRKNRYGLDLNAGVRYAANTSLRTYLKPNALASEPQDLATIDYRTVTDPDLDAQSELTATTNRTVHGVLVWFDAEIAEGIGYSNAPGAPPLVYRQRFLPFPEAVRLRAGDRVKLRLRATLSGDDYIWSWDSEVIDGSSRERRKQFRQSSFLGKIFSPQAIKTLASDHVPTGSALMEIDRDCLTMVQAGQGYSLDAIARTIHEKYPARFVTHQKALDHVAVLFKRYHEA